MLHANLRSLHPVAWVGGSLRFNRADPDGEPYRAPDDYRPPPTISGAMPRSVRFIPSGNCQNRRRRHLPTTAEERASVKTND
jgi:hypothetical protein